MLRQRRCEHGHPNLAAVRPDEHVVRHTDYKCDGPGAVLIHVVGAWSSAASNDSIDTQGREWRDERSIPIEIDALQDGFRYYTVSSANNVPSVCIEDIQTLQRAQAATSHRATRLRDARRAERDYGNQDGQRTREE